MANIDLENGNNNCVICLCQNYEELDENTQCSENNLKFINCTCKYKIHYECLGEYLKKNNFNQKCPICNNDFNPKYNIRYKILRQDSRRDIIVEFYNFIQKYLFCNNSNCLTIFLNIILTIIFFLTMVSTYLFIGGYIIKSTLFVFELKREINWYPLNYQHYIYGLYSMIIYLGCRYICKKNEEEVNEEDEIVDVTISNF